MAFELSAAARPCSTLKIAVQRVRMLLFSRPLEAFNPARVEGILTQTLEEGMS